MSGGGAPRSWSEREVRSGPKLPPPPRGRKAPRDPPGSGPLASRSPPVGCQLLPAAASRSSPPRPLGSFSSSLDSAWGFAGFWEIKTASNSGGALPGQTGPRGPCAPGYRPRLRAPCFGEPSSRRPRLRLCLPKWGPPFRSLGQRLPSCLGFSPRSLGGAVETAR